MNAKEMLEEFSNSAIHSDRNSRLTELENTVKFLEAKISKIEKAIKDIPTNYVLPAKNRKALEVTSCKQCTHLKQQNEGYESKLRKQKVYYEERVELAKEGNKKHLALMEQDKEEFKFLMMRVVGVYGTKALVDLFNHVDNPHLSSERLEQYSRIKPHY